MTNSGWVIPNAGGPYPFQSRFWESDAYILGAGTGGRGVASGCGVAEAGTPNQTVVVASGTIVISRTVIAVAGGVVSITDADATNPRFDLIYADNAGAVHVRTGTPNASPAFPNIADTEVALAQVYMPALDSAVQNAQIVDKRVFVESPATAAGWTTLSAGSDRYRNNNAALSADEDLHFPMGANTKYRIRATLVYTQLAASGIKWAFTGPASPSYLNIGGRYRRNALGASEAQIENQTAYPAGSILTLIVGVITEWTITLEGVVHNGSNATPDFAITWGQVTAVAENDTRRAGSTLEYSVA